MAVIAATMGQLSEAAERTIAAASAAIVWSGDDGHGVLAHVAAANAGLMAGTRFDYENEARGLTPAQVVKELGEDYLSTAGLVEVAGLPRLVAPAWASRVVASFLAFSSARRRDAHPNSETNAAKQLVDSAFHACRMWVEDPLDIDRIMWWTQRADEDADRCWRAVVR